MKKISLIIPCYNAVATIDICLESIVNQTIGIENMEVILVNDASTDTTFDRLCEWEQEYENSLLVVNCSENGKQGQARNIGMQYATGEYIAFMDDDDIIEPDMYETLYQKAVENQCDIAIGGSMRQEGYELLSNQEQPEDDEILTIFTVDKRYEFLGRTFNRAIWNKIYKRSFLLEHDIHFIKNNIYDDIFFSGLVKQYCQNVYITKKIFYHHVISDSCASFSSNPLDSMGYFLAHVYLIKELRVRDEYRKFEPYYEALFMQEFIRFMILFEKKHGGMNLKLYQCIKKEVLDLFPTYYTIPFVKKILNSSEYPVEKKVLQSLERKDDTN